MEEELTTTAQRHDEKRNADMNSSCRRGELWLSCKCSQPQRMGDDVTGEDSADEFKLDNSVATQGPRS